MAEKIHLAHNPDLALHPSREHHHEHLHHSANAERGRTDDAVYSKGTTDEAGVIPHQDINDDVLHRNHHPERDSTGKDPAVYDEKDYKYDAEKGSVSPAHTDKEEEDPKRHKFSRFYRKYRIFFHLAIAALFTG
jgi:CNT family concentrative nucleoside transporter